MAPPRADHREAAQEAFTRDPLRLVNALGIRVDDRQSKPPAVVWCFDGPETKASLQIGGRPEFAGQWTRYGTDETGDAFALVQRCRPGTGFPEALAFVADLYQIREDVTTPKPQAVSTTSYQVRDAAGELVATHVRKDLSDGTKEFLWKRGSEWGLRGTKPGDLPLYRLPELLELPHGTAVLVTEGEKDADAARAAGWPAVGTYGTGADPTEEALRPLADYLPILWPDNDAKGAEHANRIGEQLLALGATPLVVTWPDAPPKAGAADYLQDHSPEDLTALVAAAEEFRPIPVAPQRKRLWRGTELRDAVFPEPRYVVPQVLPEGVIAFAGRPKIGKSWLALQIAFAKACGGVTLGQRVDQGRVLYCALEDGAPRLQDRANRQGWTDGAYEGTDMLPSTLTLDELEKLTTDGGYSLAVIDTFSRLMAGSGMDHDKQGPVTEAWGRLQTLSLITGTSLLVIDHHHKAHSGDPIADIMGSTAKGAVADTVAGLYRKSGDKDAKLVVTGRDIEGVELALRFDGRDCCWHPVAENPAGVDRKHAPAILQALAEGPKSMRRISKALNGLSLSTVSLTLADLQAAGKAYTNADGMWELV